MKKLLYILVIIFSLDIFGNYSEINKTTLSQDLSLEGISIGDAVAVISKEYNIPIIAEENVKNIMLDFTFTKGETINTVINTITTIHNLKMKKIGNTFILTKKTKTSTGELSIAGKITTSNSKGLNGVKITVLKSYNPATYSTIGGNFVINDLDPGVYVIKFEKQGYESKGEIVNIDKNITNLSIVLSKSENLLSEANQASSIETNKRHINSTLIDGERYYTERIKLLNVPADEIKSMLEETYDGMIRVTPIPKVNAVIIFGKKPIVDAARDVIKNVDIGIKQVRISSQILDVSDNLFEELGFDWVYSNNGKIEDKKGTNASLLRNGIIQGIGNTLSSGLGIIRQFNSGKDMLGFSINLLESTQDLVISAIPSILIADGEEGEFKITEEVIVGEEKDENENTNKTRYTPLFREAGIIMKVIPMIQENNMIIAKIKIEVSNFKLKTTGTDDTGTYNSEGGSKIGRTIETVVKLKDGETVFIGGLKRAIIHNINSKTPILGDIPILGNLFKNKSIAKENTDIYIRLKVDIVDNEKDDFENMEIHENYNKIQSRKIY